MSGQDLDALAWLRDRDALVQFCNGGREAYLVVGRHSSKYYGKTLLEAYKIVRESYDAEEARHQLEAQRTSPEGGERSTRVLQPKMSIAGIVDSTFNIECPHIRAILVATVEGWVRAG